MTEVETETRDNDVPLTLAPFQRIGVDFLKRPTMDGKPHKLLGDDPGTGKTVMACAAAAELGVRSMLVVCPAPQAVKQAWRWHMATWGVCHHDDVFIVNSGKDQIPVDVKFIIVNYELLLNKHVRRQLAFQRYDVVIIDEAQRLKSFDSQRSNVILADDALIARGHHKWLLSGTIMPNRPWELLPILLTLAPEVIRPYTTREKFGMKFCGGLAGQDGEGNYKGASHIEELKRRLFESGFMLRRELKDVYREMPEVLERDLFIDIGDLPSGADITNCAPPTLRREIGIAKIPYIVEYLKYRLAQAPDEKVLVFTFHRDVSEKLADEFRDVSKLYYGGMSPAAKEDALRSFLENPSYKLLIAQKNSAGEAVDGLQHVSNNIVDAEPDWSGGLYEQNIGRLRRCGQDKPVYVTHLIAERTHDETIIKSRRRKQRIMHQLLNDNGSPIGLTNEVLDMSVEAELKRIGDILEARLPAPGVPLAVTAVAPTATTNGNGETPKPKVPAAAKPKSTSSPASPAATAAPTEDAVRQAANSAYNALGGDGNPDAVTKVKTVMGALGAAENSVKNLPVEKYAEAIRMYKELETGEIQTPQPAASLI